MKTAEASDSSKLFIKGHLGMSYLIDPKNIHTNLITLPAVQAPIKEKFVTVRWFLRYF